MAYYNYKVKPKHNHDWIKQLQLIDPVSSASANYNEIHFTEPNKATVSAWTRPHVTFIQDGGKVAHWYLTNSGGKWTVDGSGDTEKGQSEIAEKVVADALALNWINPAPPAKLMDTDGFTTVETDKGKKKRMQTGWKKATA